MWSFITPKIVLLLALGIVASLILFWVEYLFGFTLQAFLNVMGLVSSSLLRMPQLLVGADMTQILVLILFLGVVRSALQSLQGVFQGLAQYAFADLQRQRIVRWIFSSRSQNSGALMSIFGERTQMASYAVLSFQATVFQLTTCLFLCIYLCWLMPLITAGALAILALVFPIIRYVNRKNWKGGQQISSDWTKVNSRIMLTVRNLLLVRIYGIQEQEQKNAESDLGRILKHQNQSVWNYSMVPLIPTAVGLVLICLIVLASTRPGSQVAPGLLLSYFYIFFRFLQTIAAMSASASRFFHFFPHLKELAKWWVVESDDRPGLQVEAGPVANEKGLLTTTSPLGWKIENLSFRYSQESAVVFSNLNFEVAPGQAVVILGPSGVGKSTLLNLILGELTPQSGSVQLICDQSRYPIPSIKSEMVSRLGYVGPESFLFDGTIRDNILYGLKTKTSESQIEEALQLAECQFVHQMPSGLNHRITEQGEGLSAGQKQRLSLARALLRKPTALILDEATSNLDAETEIRLVQTLSKLKGKMTLVVVTHREPLLKIADQVLRLGTQE